MEPRAQRHSNCLGGAAGSPAQRLQLLRAHTQAKIVHCMEVLCNVFVLCVYMGGGRHTFLRIAIPVCFLFPSITLTSGPLVNSQSADTGS